MNRFRTWLAESVVLELAYRLELIIEKLDDFDRWLRPPIRPEGCVPIDPNRLIGTMRDAEPTYKSPWADLIPKNYRDKGEHTVYL